MKNILFSSNEQKNKRDWIGDVKIRNADEANIIILPKNIIKKRSNKCKEILVRLNNGQLCFHGDITEKLFFDLENLFSSKNIILRLSVYQNLRTTF